MRQFATFTLLLLLTCTAGDTQADELDVFIDDLVAAHQEKAAAPDNAAASDQYAADKASARASLGRVFPEVARFTHTEINRSTASGILEYQTTYYPERAGTTYRVTFINSIRKISASYFNRVRGLALDFNRNARRDGFRFHEYYATYTAVRGARAQGILIALGGDSYVQIEANNPVNKETLRRFADNFSARQLRQMIRSLNI